MIIGIFNDSFPPLMDGVGRVILNYKTELERLGHKVYIVAGDYNKLQNLDLIKKMDMKVLYLECQ